MTDPTPANTIDAQTVAVLARVNGVNIPADRLEAVAERLRELHRLGAPLESLDLEGIAPDNVYDPSWPDGE